MTRNGGAGEDEDALDEEQCDFRESLDCLVEFDMSHSEKLRYNPINFKKLTQVVHSSQPLAKGSLLTACFVQLVPQEKEHFIDHDFDCYRFAVLPIIGQLEETTRHGLRTSEHKVMLNPAVQ